MAKKANKAKPRSRTGWAVHDGAKRLRILEGEASPRLYKTQAAANGSGYAIGTSRLMKIRMTWEEIEQ